MSLSKKQVDAVFEIYDKGNVTYGSAIFPVESKSTRLAVGNGYYNVDVELNTYFNLDMQKQLYDLGEDRMRAAPLAAMGQMAPNR